MAVMTKRESGFSALLDRTRATEEVPPSVFEERYGAGSQQRLIALLEQPCVTFATIATHFGVSRERVRQWHRDLLPGAPTGHARQRICAQHQHRRRLLQDPLFRTFFRHARSHFETATVQPVRSRHGYRTRIARIGTHLVALRDSSLHSEEAADLPQFRYRGIAEYVYVCLGPETFLFLPASAAWAHQASGNLKATNLEVFRNSFAALNGVERRQSA